MTGGNRYEEYLLGPQDGLSCLAPERHALGPDVPGDHHRHRLRHRHDGDRSWLDQFDRQDDQQPGRQHHPDRPELYADRRREFGRRGPRDPHPGRRRRDPSGVPGRPVRGPERRRAGAARLRAPQLVPQQHHWHDTRFPHRPQVGPCGWRAVHGGRRAERRRRLRHRPDHRPSAVRRRAAPREDDPDAECQHEGCRRPQPQGREHGGTGPGRLGHGPLDHDQVPGHGLEAVHAVGGGRDRGHRSTRSTSSTRTSRRSSIRRSRRTRPRTYRS